MLTYESGKSVDIWPVLTGLLASFYWTFGEEYFTNFPFFWPSH